MAPRASRDYAARAAVAPDSKRRVAARAAALIRPGSAVLWRLEEITAVVTDVDPHDARRRGTRPARHPGDFRRILMYVSPHETSSVNIRTIQR